MTPVYIALGTLVAGMGSVLIAAWIARALLARYTQHLLSLAAGALLATAFMHLLDRKSTRLNSSHSQQSRMPSSA